MNKDLSGDDVKVVGYTIFFTKPDAEAVLQPERQELVNYPTDAASFAGLKVADFLERVQRNGIPWPSEWKELPGDGYPEPGQPIRQIPEVDRKYLRLDFSGTVVGQAPKEGKAGNLEKPSRSQPDTHLR